MLELNYYFPAADNLFLLPNLSDMKLDCAPGVLTLVWTETRSQSDLSLLRLGSCYPTSISLREAVFSVGYDDCNFRRKVG